MQRLILEIAQSDCCTYSCTELYPVLGDTPEQFLADFRHRLLSMQEDEKFIFGGVELRPQDFDFISPNRANRTIIAVYTVDEWFEQHAET